MLISLALSGEQRFWLEVITVFVLIGIIIIGYFLSTFITGAGYEPVPSRILDRMIDLSTPKKGQRVYDLGSGFGRILIRVAQVTGASCTGVEVDPLKVWWTRRAIRSAA